MFQDGQLRFVVENLIKDIGCVSKRGWNWLGTILGKLVAGPAIEGDAFAVTKVAR